MKSHILLIFVFALFLLPKHSEGQRWTGDIDNSWEKPGNWSPETVPGNNSVVYIRALLTDNYPVITDDVTVREIIISDWYNGGILTVRNGATLTVTNRFKIGGNGSLLLDNGNFSFEGKGIWNSAISVEQNSQINISNGGTMDILNDKLTIDGTLLVDSGNVNFGNGFQLSNNKLFEVKKGDISFYGKTYIYGILNGGAGNFVFNGDSSTGEMNQDKVTISNGGRFYMAPVSSGNTSPDCSDDAELSGGTVDFYIPAYVGNNGIFNGGNALVVFSNTVETHSGSIVQMYNGILTFKGNANVRDGAEIEIFCKGTIAIEGNGTFQHDGNMIVGDGNLIVSGDAVFQNGGTLEANDGKIVFEGDVTIANNGGKISAGSSMLTFSGGVFDNSGTFDADSSTFVFSGDGNQKIVGFNSDIEFYNLIVEDGADVQAFQNVIVSNDMTVDDDGRFSVDEGMSIDVVGNIIGDSFINTNRPYIISITINSVNSITAIFNEELDPSSIPAISSPWWPWWSTYKVRDDDGNVIDNSPNNPMLGGENNNEITLTLNFDIERNKKYYLIVNNIKNLNGESISWYHKKRFVWSAPKDLWQWTGLVDSVWTKSGNWFALELPKDDSRVLVPVTPHDPVIFSTNNKINVLEIKEGASLTIYSSGNLTVDDSIKNEAGRTGLVISSSAEGTGSLISHNDGVPASFQRYISGGAEAWQMLSSPVSDQEISGDFTPTGTLNGNKPYGDSTRYDIYAWYEPDTSWVYLLNNDQPPTWSTANEGNDNFVPGRGYLVAYKDSFPTKIFKGFLNNGDVEIQLTNTEGGASEFGFNLVGNPYPSSIDWKSNIGWNRSILESSEGGYDIWIWSEENMNYGAYNSNSDSDEGTLGVSRYIAPNQGFFVKTAKSGTFSMNNEVRVNEGSSNWIKSTSLVEQNGINIRLEAPKGYGEDEVLIELETNGTEAGTCKKFSFVATAPSLYLPNDGKNYSIRLLGEKEDNPVIPLAFKAGINGNYTLTADFDPSEFEILDLYDKETGTTYDLKVNNKYTFLGNPGDNPGRFVLQLVKGIYADPYADFPVRIYAWDKVINIDLRLVDGTLKCDVYSIAGRKVMSKNNIEGGQIVQLSVLPVTGIYIVRVSGKKGSYSQKVSVF